jgi:cytochrome c oxidase subunit III
MNQQVNDFRSLPTHPYSIMMYLLLAGLTMLFIALSGAYLYTRFQSGEAPIKIPLLFLINTGVLYGSGWTLKQAKSCYLKDDTEGYKRALLFTVLLTLGFMVLQYVGWGMLKSENPHLFGNTDKPSNMPAYVYVISVIHFFHIIGGLPFFFVFLWKAYTQLKDPVTVLVYFSDPVKQLSLRLLTLYWNFLDYLWIYLMVFFWANYFVQF